MDIYCDECGAEFAEHCHCPKSEAEMVSLARYAESLTEPETWRGMDGHKYTGNPKRASMASHDDDCGCPGSVNFDPESWY